MRSHYERVTNLHEGKYVCLWEAPETILEVIDWETELKEIHQPGSLGPIHVNGETYVQCKRVFGPGLDLDQIIHYVNHGPCQNRVLLQDLCEPNPMLVLAYEASRAEV